MKSLLAFFGFGILLFSCEADLQVYTDDFYPTPVVYCLINPIDSVHHIRLSKSINAEISPDEQRGNPESFVFEDASITVRLIKSSGDTIYLNAIKDECEKLPGYFGDGSHSIYSFTQVMTRNYISLFKEIELIIEIPGYPLIRGKTDILIRPRIRQPNIHAQYLFVDPERPILVQWYGSAWNEVDIRFDIMEQYRDSIAVQSFIFEERTDIIMKEGICDVRFPYDLIVQNLVRSLDPRKDLVRRYFGPILIQVHSANEDFAIYMDTKDGINDFSGNTTSNLENAIGFLGCKLSFSFDSLYFDYLTRIRLAEDPLLMPYKFKEY